MKFDIGLRLLAGYKGGLLLRERSGGKGKGKGEEGKGLRRGGGKEKLRLSLIHI